MNHSDPYLKRFTVILIIGIAALIGIIILSFVDLPRPRSHQRLSPHAILQATNMEEVWQRGDIYTDRGDEYGVSLQAQDRKIFFIGNVVPRYPNYGFVLRAENGNMIAKTEPVEGAFSFTTDGTAFYIGTTQGNELYKYDYQSGKRVWTRKMGVDKSPCCFQIINGDLLTNWYQGFYRISASDGSLLEQRLWEGTFFSIENGVYYLTGDGNLIGSDSAGRRVWDAKIYREIKYPPIFQDNLVFIRTDREQGRLYVVDQRTANLLWKGDWSIISNVAVSPRRVYFLTENGYLLGVNEANGETETSVRFSPETFYDFQRDQSNSYQVAYDEASGLVFLLLGDSGQLIAFRETP